MACSRACWRLASRSAGDCKEIVLWDEIPVYSCIRCEVLTLVFLWRVWRALIDPYPDKATLARDLPQVWKARASQRRGATDHWRQMLLEEAESMAKRSPEELAAAGRQARWSQTPSSPRVG
jgi:hypothetical protein